MPTYCQVQTVPPERISQQLFPSTNSLVVFLKDRRDLAYRSQCQSQIYDICNSVSRGRLQFISFDSSDLPSVAVTVSDVRDAWTLFRKFRDTPALSERFACVLDMAGGSNRSVILPTMGVAMSLVLEKLSQFGEIEKVWLDGPKVIVDFYDSTAPLKVVGYLESVQDSLKLHDATRLDESTRSEKVSSESDTPIS